MNPRKVEKSMPQTPQEPQGQAQSTSPMSDNPPPPAPAQQASTLAGHAMQGEGDGSISQPENLPPRRRGSFGVPIPKLSLEGRTRPGYVPRWINDSPGRINRAKECGYQHILDDEKKPISFVVDKHTGMTAYAMEIPKEFYDEDYAKKQLGEDAKEIALMRDAISDKGYRPTVGGTDQPVTQARVMRGQTPSF